MEDIEKTEESFEVLIDERKWNRISMAFIFQSVFDAFSIERGGIYTLRRLFSNPAQMAKDYLGKERFHFTPPFRLLIVTTALAIYIFSELGFGEQFLNDIQEGAKNGADGNTTGPEAIIEIIKGWSNYTNLILWTLIPILALFTYLFNRKLKFNYAEHLVLQTYFFCLTNILTFIFLFQFIIDKAILSNILSLLSLVYFIYFYKVAFSKGIGRSILDSILVYLLATIVWIVLLGGILILQVAINRI
jgi:hypothetical protein